MHPVSSRPPHPPSAAHVHGIRPHAPGEDPLARAPTDVEVSVRVHADGTQITVVRRTVAGDGGQRAVGIEAVIR